MNNKQQQQKIVTFLYREITQIDIFASIVGTGDGLLSIQWRTTVSAMAAHFTARPIMMMMMQMMVQMMMVILYAGTIANHTAQATIGGAHNNHAIRHATIHSQTNFRISYKADIIR